MTTLFLNKEKAGKRILNSIKERLITIEKSLKEIDSMQNKVEAIVKLFQVISPLQDENLFAGDLQKLQKLGKKFQPEIESISTIRTHLERAGRNIYGMNRTKIGEQVTSDKVYLGDVFGLWTNTASFFLQKREMLEKQERLDVSKDPKNPVSSWYLINDYQCGNFIKSHTSGMLAEIKKLSA